VLVVNVEPRFGDAVVHYLEERGWKVLRPSDPREALAPWDAAGLRLVVTDLDGTDMDGFEFLQALSALHPRPGVIVRAPHASAAQLDPTVVPMLGIETLLERPCRLDAVALALWRGTSVESSGVLGATDAARRLSPAVQP
jgi:DNA-binding response OmpR family regulator